jgi:hypothetical protein
MNGIIEGCAIPPIHRKKGKWMGHGAYAVGSAPVKSLKASKAAQYGNREMLGL